MGFAIAGLVVAIVSAAVSAYAASEQAATQRKIGKFNAKVAENAAKARRDAAAIEAQNRREQYAGIMAANRASLGASGVLPTEGSPLIVQMADAESAALNEARVRYSGEVGARADESEAVIQRYIGRQSARATRAAGYVQAGSTLLQGLTSYGRSQQGRTTYDQNV